MKLVILESPYAGDVERNVMYAKRCMLDALSRGEAPIASHLLWTQPHLLDDNNSVQRRQGIDAGLAWYRVAEACVCYTDYGMSKGMEAAVECARIHGVEVHYRMIGRAAISC